MKTVVIGAGAAGMMCALTAARNGAEVVLLERNDKCGRKLSITGKGRCNVTNACDREIFLSSVVHNSRFLYGAWADFSSDDVMRFFESCGVPLKTERGNRVFPQSDRAADIVSALENACLESGVAIFRGKAVQVLRGPSGVCGVRTAAGETFPAERVVIACGGMSYPVTGSDGSGFDLARDCGHTVVSPRPSLVPWETEEVELCRAMQGVSLKNAALTAEKDGKLLYRDFGEMMFTHFGVTGPTVLSASAFFVPGARLHIDLKPALSAEQLDRRVLSDLEKYRAKTLPNAFADLLPRKMILPFLDLCGFDPARKGYEITREQRRTAVARLKDICLTVTRPRPFAEAIVTAGGVDVTEVNPKTMESRLVPGLYFCGEVLDVDAFTGGFNLQIAFSTGHLAGSALSGMK